MPSLLATSLDFLLAVGFSQSNGLGLLADPTEYAFVTGYVTALILGGLLRNEDHATHVRPLKDEDGVLTGHRHHDRVGRPYILSIAPVADFGEES
jgi:hypothetical protein